MDNENPGYIPGVYYFILLTTYKSTAYYTPQSSFGCQLP
jgi:hypothetical protein